MVGLRTSLMRIRLALRRLTRRLWFELAHGYPYPDEEYLLEESWREAGVALGFIQGAESRRRARRREA